VQAARDSLQQLRDRGISALKEDVHIVLSRVVDLSAEQKQLEADIQEFKLGTLLSREETEVLLQQLGASLEEYPALREPMPHSTLRGTWQEVKGVHDEVVGGLKMLQNAKGSLHTLEELATELWQAQTGFGTCITRLRKTMVRLFGARQTVTEYELEQAVDDADSQVERLTENGLFGAANTIRREVLSRLQEALDETLALKGPPADNAQANRQMGFETQDDLCGYVLKKCLVGSGRNSMEPEMAAGAIGVVVQGPDGDGDLRLRLESGDVTGHIHRSWFEVVETPAEIKQKKLQEQKDRQMSILV